MRKLRETADIRLLVRHVSFKKENSVMHILNLCKSFKYLQFHNTSEILEASLKFSQLFIAYADNCSMTLMNLKEKKIDARKMIWIEI